MSRSRSSRDGLDQLLSAPANPCRRRILELLSRRPYSTNELDRNIPAPWTFRFAVMQHLKVLESADLIVSSRHTRTRTNHLNPVPIQQVVTRWLSRFNQPPAPAVRILKRRRRRNFQGSYGQPAPP